jgi:hypothetical protein
MNGERGAKNHHLRLTNLWDVVTGRLVGEFPAKPLRSFGFARLLFVLGVSVQGCADCRELLAQNAFRSRFCECDAQSAGIMQNAAVPRTAPRAALHLPRSTFTTPLVEDRRFG